MSIGGRRKSSMGAARRPLKRRKGKQNVGAAALAWLECARCGGDVWAPEDVDATCDRCTLVAALKEVPDDKTPRNP